MAAGNNGRGRRAAEKRERKICGVLRKIAAIGYEFRKIAIKARFKPEYINAIIA